MRNYTLYKAILLFLLMLTSFSALAWGRGISIGYGSGEDPNHHNYKNYGTYLSAQLTTLKQKKWMNITLDGSLGDWHSTAVMHKKLFTAALTFSLRAYLFRFLCAHPYFLISTGPAYLSRTQFGQNTQGAQLAFQTTLGAGVEMGRKHTFDLNVKLVHYSNAYLTHPNEGFNIFPVVSIGYLFP